MWEYFQRLVSEWRSWIYDELIESMTAQWYREVLRLCPSNVSVLDVGIGTASSLIANRDYVVTKKLQITGIEYTREYAEFATRQLQKSLLNHSVHVTECDIYEYNTDYKERYDIIYFSGSFMILPEPERALIHCTNMLRSYIPKLPDSGNIFFSQTFEKRTLIGNYLVPLLKRFLRLLTTIDFGKVTYEDDFRQVLTRANVDVIKKIVLHDSAFRSQVIIVARPKLNVPFIKTKQSELSRNFIDKFNKIKL